MDRLIGRDRASQLVQQFPGHRILVLGDLILDRYVWGNTDRISPEAPVPIVRVESESIMLGGAGNVARNLASLGAHVEVLGLVGEDETAAQLEGLFDRWKIDTRILLRESSRPTTLKTRVISRGQQVVRYDRESEDPISGALAGRLLDALRSGAARAQAAIVQNYGKGLLTPEVVCEAMTIFEEQGVRVFVDPKEPPWEIYRGAELIKPNQREAEELTHIRVREEADIERIGNQLLALCNGATIAVTRGGSGTTLFTSDKGMCHVPTQRHEVSDVAGAGDTAIAALTLARLSAGSWRESAELANLAAGVVVQIAGTATITPQELLEAVGANS
jgi:D-beta-D-heptose 7-phosphate kinase/D-beta-D-heptose 1-phosphate adenosyltransferase